MSYLIFLQLFFGLYVVVYVVRRWDQGKYIAQDFRRQPVHRGHDASARVIVKLQRSSRRLSLVENALQASNLLVESCQLGGRRGNDCVIMRRIGWLAIGAQETGEQGGFYWIWEQF
jgi:hypothetical protein